MFLKCFKLHIEGERQRKREAELEEAEQVLKLQEKLSICALLMSLLWDRN